ncbi:MFS transporter, partial [Solirubrobacter sp. CPCC 204708]|nr:MFS transporter [Solirubrobacter deserti]
MTSTAIDVPKGTDTLNDSQETPSSWSGVFAMSVCAFALIASEFLPVSLLTPMARDLQVT